MTQPSQVTRTVRRLALGTVAMFGFGYALVPIYNVACEQFGLNGRSSTLGEQRAAETAGASSQVDKARLVTVEFLGNTAGDLGWDFAPAVSRLSVHPGAIVVVNYRAHNRSAHDTVGQAVPSVAPGPAAKHFHKLECFCFTRQPLAAGASKDMQVRFQIDPDLDAAISTVTLSYTFFEVEAAVSSAG